jgi:hypothetical protein
MSVPKKYVLNCARSEGSVAKGYVTEEVIKFCVARVSLLLKPLLRRGEGGGLVRQLDPQLLSPVGPFLDLALPRPCSLEGCTVLLELGANRGHLRLPLRCHGPHCGCVLTRLLQHHISLQECRSHLRDCGGVFCSLGILLQELVRTAWSRYSNHPLSVRRASTRVSRASYWSRYQLRSELSQSRRPYFSRARPSNSCHRRTRQERNGVGRSTNAGETRGEETPNSNRKNAYLENPPRRTPVDLQCLVQRVVERGVVVAELLPQRLLSPGLVEVGWRGAVLLPLTLRARHGAIVGGRAGT